MIIPIVKMRIRTREEIIMGSILIGLFPAARSLVIVESSDVCGIMKCKNSRIYFITLLLIKVIIESRSARIGETIKNMTYEMTIEITELLVTIPIKMISE